MNFTGTTNELADLLGVEYVVAAGLLRYLKEKGIATETGSRPNKAGKGKPSVIFQIPYRVELIFGKPVDAIDGENAARNAIAGDDNPARFGSPATPV